MEYFHSMICFSKERSKVGNLSGKMEGWGEKISAPLGLSLPALLQVRS